MARSKNVNGEAGDEVVKKVRTGKDYTDAERESAAEDPITKMNRIDKVLADAKPSKALNLPQLELKLIRLVIIGDEPLICHAWSKKAITEMLNKQMGVATVGKEAKDPERDFQESLYYHPDSTPEKPVYGFPSIAFKNAAVTACTSLGKAITKVQARQAFHIVGEMVKINGKPEKRQDMVRVGMGTADIRFRGEFKKWSAELTVRYNARVLSEEQIVNLFNIAGFAVGIGEWRPERDGQSGLFHVKRGSDDE